jgi:hypothetical protein
MSIADASTHSASTPSQPRIDPVDGTSCIAASMR